MLHPVFDLFAARADPISNVVGATTRRELFTETLRFVGLAEPPCDTELFEWIDVLEAVTRAERSFVMIDLGAGFGRWTVDAAAALRLCNAAMPYKVVAVEAEPTHAAWPPEHCADNDVDLEVIEAALAAARGLLDRHPNLVYRGNAQHSRELPNVFASTRVNVCLSNCLIHRGVPSKFIDCVASGGFALVDAKPDLVALFGTDVEAVFFRNGSELKAKIEYFLDRPHERREIVEHLHSRIEQECTLERMFARVRATVELGSSGGWSPSRA